MHDHTISLLRASAVEHTSSQGFYAQGEGGMKIQVLQLDNQKLLKKANLEVLLVHTEDG